MRTFKFLNNNQRSRDFNSGIIYEFEYAGQPIRNAIVDAIRICNISDIRYENYEHHFHYDARHFKLKVYEIRRYRNPVHSYYVIRYAVASFNVNLDDLDVNQWLIQLQKT